MYICMPAFVCQQERSVTLYEMIHAVCHLEGLSVGKRQISLQHSSETIKHHQPNHRSHDDWISAPERPDYQSAKDCQLRNRCINRNKVFNASCIV
ncbi:hypothetical protein CVS40_4861 [Lucilia cuprina]|nr:hypothetical protein CVS40_4861 [Lucilia cuprina]